MTSKGSKAGRGGGKGGRAGGGSGRAGGSGARASSNGARAGAPGARSGAPGVRSAAQARRTGAPGARSGGSGARANGSGARANGSGTRANGSGTRANGSGARANGSGARAHVDRTLAAGAAPARADVVDGQRRRGRPPRAVAAASYGAYPGERVIHRYANRRYYDLMESRAVTLEQVADLVRQRHSVRVIDVDGGNLDITHRVLGQILTDSGGEQLELLPVELLRRLIAPLDAGMLDWARQYLAIGAELIDRGAAKGSPRAADALQRLTKLLDDSHLHEHGKQARSGPRETPRAGRQPHIDERIEELRQRLEDLTKLRGF